MIKLNDNLRNKLSQLENATININWNDKSELLVGTALQPPLKVILSRGFDFYMFFNNILRNINEQLKNMDVRNERTMLKFKKAFNSDFEDETVRYFLALTQYMYEAGSV